MDFRFSEEEEKFRQEVRDFFNHEKKGVAGAQEEWDTGQGFGPSCWDILRKIGEKGFAVPPGRKNTEAWSCPICIDISFRNRCIILPTYGER